MSALEGILSDLLSNLLQPIFTQLYELFDLYALLGSVFGVLSVVWAGLKVAGAAIDVIRKVKEVKE